jgi:hypothetical protein
MQEITVNTCASLAVDSHGNRVIVGYLKYSGDLITKWSREGVNIWTVGEDSKCIFSSIAVDTTDDSIYALGNRYQENGKPEGLLVKYDTIGEPMWVRTMTAYGYGLFSTLSLDKSGNVIVSGDVGTRKKNRTTDSSVSKISKAGDLLWETVVSSYQHYLTVNDYYLIDTAVDSKCNIYGCGTVSRVVNSPGFLVKLSTNGELVWKKVIDTKRDFQLTSVTVDDDDNVYTGGRYLDHFTEIYGTECYGHLFKWSPDGDKLFEIVEKNQQASHLVISYCKKGYLITAGPVKIKSRDKTQLLFRKLSLDGKILDTVSTVGDPFRIKSKSLAVSDNGEVLIVGYPKDNTNLYGILPVEI